MLQKTENPSTNAEFECDACGVPVSKDATVCPNCGVVFSDEEDETEQEESVVDNLSEFNKVSRFTCTFGVGLALAILLLLGSVGEIIRVATRDPLTAIVQTTIGIIVGIPLTVGVVGLYLLPPYHVYQRSVVQNEDVGCAEELLLLYFWVGIFGAFILVFIFDVIRLALKAIMKPEHADEIDFWYLKPKTKAA